MGPARVGTGVIGEAMALGAAAVWAVSLILFKQSESAGALGMNLFKNAVGIVLLGLTMLALGIGFADDRSAGDWAALSISGVLGIAVADTLTFVALRRLGAGLLAVVDTLYAPTIIAFSVVVLAEPLGPAFAAGAALVALGLLLASLEGAGTVHGRGRGIAIGIAGIVAMAAGVVLAKPVLERGHLVEVTMVRLIAGFAAQLVWVAVFPGQRGALSALWPTRTWGTLLPASILGSYIAMLLWLGGFQHAPASVASVLNQMSTVFTLVLAWAVLGERVSARRAVGAALAVAGALVVLSSTW